MAERDLIDLYSKRILALAADIPHVGRLDAPMGTSRVRAPLCGSVVTVDLDLKDNRISRFAQDVKACALGQAAAAVVGSADGAWHRQDPRGNKPGVDAQFSIGTENLVYRVDESLGEWDYRTLYDEPAPEVVAALTGTSDVLVCQLPAELAQQ